MGRRTQEHLDELHAAYRERRLSLILGAGLSYPYGLPDWNELLVGLLLSSGFDRYYPHYRAPLAQFLADDFGFSPLSLARAIRARGRDKHGIDDRDFLQQVRRALYANRIEPTDATLLEEVAMLIKAGHRTRQSRLSHIITLNFDDLLEQRLRALGVDAWSAYAGDSRLRDGIRVVHPHGYLPQRGKIPKQKLVFSEDEYHRVSLEPFNWAALQLATAMQDTTCLFLGVSMTDPNVRRLLDACRDTRPGPRHYVLRRDPAMEEQHWTQRVEVIQAQAREQRARRGLLEGRPDDGETKTRAELHRLMRRIGVRARRYERQLMRELGVGAIYVHNFSDMPPLVRAIHRRP